MEDVVGISTNYLPAHAEGRKLLAAGDATAAQKLLESAYDDESRDWVRREILSLLVGIAVLANLNGINLRRSVAEATRTFAGIDEKEDKPGKAIDPDAKELAAIAGTYKQCDFTWKYSAQNGKLVREFEGARTEMTRRAPWYYASDDGQDAVFLLNSSGAVEYVHSDLVSAKKQ